MDNSIAINDSMPEELKDAIQYLNENNIGINTPIEGADDPIEFVDDNNEGSTFTADGTDDTPEENFDVEGEDDNEIDSDVTLNDINQLLDDCIAEDDVDTSDLDSIF